jgi:hypothetical protein
MIQLKINKFTPLLVVLFSAVLFSCVKEKKFFSTETGDVNRGTSVKIVDANDVILRARDVAPTLDEFVLLEVTRNPSTQAELNSPLTVTLVKNSAYITTYNSAHGTSFVELPAANYTLLDDVNLTFQPGEFSRQIRIRVNKTGLDLSAQYALAFTISQVNGSGAKISPDFKNALVQVIIKNKYDGVYSVVSGNVIRYTAPGVPAGDALSGSLAGNPDVTLATVGPNTVEITGLNWAASGGGVGGIANLRATVDPVTNLVTMQALGAPTLTNWAGKENKYDPATKTFYLAFRWNPTTTTREYEIVLKYKGPR